MFKQICPKLSVPSIFFLILTVFLMGVTGCATTDTRPAAEAPSDRPPEMAAEAAETSAPSGEKILEKRITGIDVKETEAAWVVAVQANHVPDYTLAESPLEQEAVLYFAESQLSLDSAKYPSESDVIGTVTAIDLIKNGPCKIVIPILQAGELKSGVTYEAHRAKSDKKTVEVVFYKPTAAPEKSAAQTAASDKAAPPAEEIVKSARKAAEAAAAERKLAQAPEASRLEKIETNVAPEGVAVKIAADGAIRDYKSFTLTGPPRIVYDMVGVKTGYSKEKQVAVDSDIVKKVRYFAHPKFLRVVLDVDPAYLSQYNGGALADGFLVGVGDLPPAMMAGLGGAAGKVLIASSKASDKKGPAAPAKTAAETAAAAPAEKTPARAETESSAPDKPAEPKDSPADMKATDQQKAENAAATSESAPKDKATDSEKGPKTSSDLAEDDPKTEKPSAPAGAKAAGDSEKSDTTVDASRYDKPALVNKIDFIQNENGSSTVVIGTTHPVNYDLTKTGEKSLKLTLKGADILSFRQRPLITTRFDSALDVITPIQTQKMKERDHQSVVKFDLRQKVDYEAQRRGNTIRLEFAASSERAEPAKKVVIPTEHMMAEAETETEQPAPTKPEETKTSPADQQPAPATPEEPSQAAEPSPAEPAQRPSPATEETAATAAADSDQAAPSEPQATPPESGPAEKVAPADVSTAPTLSEIPEQPQKPASLSSQVGDDASLLTPQEKFTGEPIALDFYETDIRNVIRILKDVSGKNFAIDKDVTGSVTLSFVNPVPWDQVLALILDMNDLGMVEKGGIVRIATQETLRKQKEATKAALAAQQDLKKTEEQLVPLHTEYFAVSYAEAKSEVLPHIEALLSGRGSAQVDTRTNQLIMTDVADRIEKAREVISKIDRVTPQVMIKARIVETSTDFSRELGTQWGVDNNANTYGNTETDQINRAGTYRDDIDGAEGTFLYDVALNALSSPAQTSLGLDFARIVGTPFSLDARLSLMENQGEGKIISTPKIVTLDNKEAVISQGEEIPYTTISDEGVETEFKDAELELRVTPHVTPDNRISMKINVTQKEPQAGAGDEPPLNTKEATTELLVNDGDTVVIGGIMQQSSTSSVSGVPWLSKIPVLGNLFKYRRASEDKDELLIFITPTVVRLD